MKNIFILIVSIITISYAQIQKINIKGQPKRLNNEIVGKRDVNGEYCAAIKVISNLKNLKYTSYNGVVKVKNLPSQDIVYLSANERVLTIYHSRHKPRKIILKENGINLKPKSMWKLHIRGNRERIKKLKNIKFAISGGINFSTFTGSYSRVEGNNSNYGLHNFLINYTIGGFLRYRIKNKLSIRPELRYTKRGCRLDSTKTLIYSLGYSDLAIIGKYKLKNKFDGLVKSNRLFCKPNIYRHLL